MSAQQEGAAAQAAKAQVKLARSASDLKASAEQQTDSADRRTELAADRTVLAAERTYAAWVRTGLAALASGVGARALLDGVVATPLAMIAGGLLVLFSAFCFLAAIWRQMIRVAPPRPDTPRLPSWLLVAVNGVLILVSLAAFLGVLTQ